MIFLKTMVAKRTVCIFSNYDASEKTLCALYLASYIVKQYRYCVWVAPYKVYRSSKYFGFSHQWDNRVMSLNDQKEAIRTRLSNCEICFLFDESETLLSLLPPSTKTAFFLDPHTWNPPTSPDFAKKCTYLLASSSYVTKKIVEPNVFHHDILCPFDPAAHIIPRPRIQSGDTASLFYNAYGMSLAERQCVQQIAEIVKQCCPESKSVVCCYTAKLKPEHGFDPLTYDWRLFDYLKQSDWIIDLNPRPLHGFFAAFAGALGIQWSCLNIPPNTDKYSAARRHLIPYPEGGLLPQNVEVIAGHIVRQLMEKFNSDLDRDRDVGSYIKRFDKFIETMNQMLGTKKEKFDDR
jgi:hypothetical protein